VHALALSRSRFGCRDVNTGQPVSRTTPPDAMQIAREFRLHSAPHQLSALTSWYPESKQSSPCPSKIALYCSIRRCYCRHPTRRLRCDGKPPASIPEPNRTVYARSQTALSAPLTEDRYRHSRSPQRILRPCATRLQAACVLPLQNSEPGSQPG